MQAKFYLALAFTFLAGAIYLGWAALHRQSMSENEVAEYRMRKFAGRIERLARKQHPRNAEELRELIAKELRGANAPIILAGLRGDTQPFRMVHVQNGVALIGSYPIEFHGQHITLRLATMIEGPAPYRAARRLAA
jgi:hypothetical protein